MESRTLLAILGLLTGSAEADFPDFEAITIDGEADKVVYAVTIADVNSDKRPDIVAVTDPAVYWYAAPDWTKHTIIADQTERDNVCIAAHDIDRDGKVDFALGAGWTKKGTIQWLSRGSSLDKKWSVHQIGVEPWLHRMRFADVLGTGRPQLVISPLNKEKRKGVRLTAFSIPDDPKTDRWLPTVLDESMDRMHNHWHLDVNGDKSIDTVTASVEGVHLVQRTSGGWKKSRIGLGETDGKAKGAGEVKSGRLADGRQFFATVEPMHGDKLAIYVQNDGDWKRHVLVENMKRGHAVWVANLDDDKDDEIIFGHSDLGTANIPGPGVFVLDKNGDDLKSWKRYTIDSGGVATEDVVGADLNGDGRTDIVAGGRATHNVRLYINRGSN